MIWLWEAKVFVGKNVVFGSPFVRVPNSLSNFLMFLLKLLVCGAFKVHSQRLGRFVYKQPLPMKIPCNCT